MNIRIIKFYTIMKINNNMDLSSFTCRNRADKKGEDFLPWPYYLLIICFLTFIFFSIPATAQEYCDSPKEAIENLRAPRMASPYVWDIFYGDADKEEAFTAFYPLQDDKILTAGTVKTGKKETPFIILFDRRNRPVWSWYDLDIKGGPRNIRIEKILAVEGKKPSYLLAGRYIPENGLEKIWIGLFDEAGKKQGEHILSDPKKHLRFFDLIRDIKGTGWVMSSQLVQKNENEPVHSRISGLNSTFSPIWSREFVTGTDNQINALAIGQELSGNRFYVAAGNLVSDNGRRQGLMLRFDSQGDIDWQRQFSRGSNAELHTVAFTQDGQLLVGGDVQAGNGAILGGGWLMKIDAGSGQAEWNRYYARPETAYRIKDINTLPDGRMSVALSGTVIRHKDYQSHSRMILLSARGEMLNDETFTAGKGISLADSMIGLIDHRLYFGGTAKIEEPDPKNPDTAKIISDQAWLVVRAAYSDYKDPCTGGIKPAPIENKSPTP